MSLSLLLFFVYSLSLPQDLKPPYIDDNPILRSRMDAALKSQNSTHTNSTTNPSSSSSSSSSYSSSSSSSTAQLRRSACQQLVLQRRERVRSVLSVHASVCDTRILLDLCIRYGYRRGVLYLYERSHQYKAVLQFYMDCRVRNSTEGHRMRQRMGGNKGRKRRFGGGYGGMGRGIGGEDNEEMMEYSSVVEEESEELDEEEEYDEDEEEEDDEREEEEYENEYEKREENSVFSGDSRANQFNTSVNSLQQRQPSRSTQNTPQPIQSSSSSYSYEQQQKQQQRNYSANQSINAVSVSSSAAALPEQFGVSESSESENERNTQIKRDNSLSYRNTLSGPVGMDQSEKLTLKGVPRNSASYIDKTGQINSNMSTENRKNKHTQRKRVSKRVRNSRAFVTIGENAETFAGEEDEEEEEDEEMLSNVMSEEEKYKHIVATCEEHGIPREVCWVFNLFLLF